MFQVTHMIGFGAHARQMLVDRTLGTNIGDLVNNGGLAAAFDGNTNQNAAASAGKSVSSSGFTNFLGKTYANAKIISKVVVYAPNNAGINGSGGAALAKLQGSNDGFASEIVEMYASGGTVGASGTNFTMTPTTERAFKSWRLVINGNGTALTEPALPRWNFGKRLKQPRSGCAVFEWYA